MATTTTLSASPTPSSSTWVPPANGITGGYPGNDTTILRAMTAFTAIAWYNAIELLILIFLRFKKYEGLYVWSLFVTSFAIIVYQLGAWGNMLQIANNEIIMVTFQNIGWIFMVVGQSLVLYSRLHIITLSQGVLRFVLWMIIINSVLMYIPTTALNYGTIVHLTKPWVDGYNIMERIQMTLFSVQEIIISSIYLWEVRRFLKVWEDDTRKLTYELVIVNVLLILLDVALLSVEFLDLYMIETTLKGMVYSIKLKLELGVLSKMVKIVKVRQEMRTVPNAADIDLRKYSSPQTAQHFADPFPKRASDGSAASSAKDLPQTHRPEAPVQQPLQFPTATAQPPSAEMPSARPSASRMSSTQDLYPGRLVTE